MSFPLFEFLLFILGLSVGSFLNVVIDRVPKKESIIKKRSYCDKCKKALAWFDLIPLLSFIVLGGKCRYCHYRISLYNPLVELTTGVLFIYTFLYQSLPIPDLNLLSILSSIETFYIFFIMSSLIVIFFTDLKYGIIPNSVLILSVIVSVLYLFFIHSSLFITHVFSAIGAFLFFLLIFLVTRGRGIGFGDVKLSFLLGLFLGFPKIVVALYLAFLTGALISAILVLWGKKRFFGGTVPFGPFLVLGTLISLFWGEDILVWALLSLSFW